MAHRIVLAGDAMVVVHVGGDDSWRLADRRREVWTPVVDERARRLHECRGLVPGWMQPYRVTAARS